MVYWGQGGHELLNSGNYGRYLVDMTANKTGLSLKYSKTKYNTLSRGKIKRYDRILEYRGEDVQQ